MSQIPCDFESDGIPEPLQLTMPCCGEDTCKWEERAHELEGDATQML